MSEFTVQTFKINTINEKGETASVEKQGLVNGEFGIFQSAWVTNDGQKTPFFSVTHLPSGTRTYPASTLTTAQEIVRDLLSFTTIDWTKSEFTTPDERNALAGLHRKLLPHYRAIGWLCEGVKGCREEITGSETEEKQ